MKLGPVVLSPGSHVGKNDLIVGHIEAVKMDLGNDDEVDVFGQNHSIVQPSHSNNLPGSHIVTPMAEAPGVAANHIGRGKYSGERREGPAPKRLGF